MLPRALKSRLRRILFSVCVIVTLYVFGLSAQRRFLQVETAKITSSIPPSKIAFIHQELRNEVDGIHDIRRQYPMPRKTPCVPSSLLKDVLKEKS